MVREREALAASARRRAGARDDERGRATGARRGGARARGGARRGPARARGRYRAARGFS